MTPFVEDETEDFRRKRQNELNAEKASRAWLETRYGQVWTTTELGKEFEMRGFAAPYVMVKRRSDGAMGSLEFQHSPRFYFNWEEAC